MHALARGLGLSVRVHNEMGDVRQHRFYKSRAFCSVYILTTYIDTWLSRIKYARAARRCDYVICDRWVTDIIADLATKTRRKEFPASRWAGRFLKILPRDSRLFIVYRNTDDILECRLENRIDPDFERRREVYARMLRMPYITPVDNRGTISDSVNQIIKSIGNA